MEKLKHFEEGTIYKELTINELVIEDYFPILNNNKEKYNFEFNNKTFTKEIIEQLIKELYELQERKGDE